MRFGIPVTGAAIFGMASMAALTLNAQELSFVCDTDNDGTITAEGSQGCAEQRFETVRGGADELGEQEFATAFPEAEGPQEQFAQVDQDGNGKISRQEWMSWHDQAFAEATAESAGEMAGADYEAWQGDPWAVAEPTGN